MERRKFIKTAGEAAIITPVIPLITGGQSSGKTTKSANRPEVFKSTVLVKEDSIFVTTSTLTATMTNGSLTSLKNKLTGEEFITSFDTGIFTALQILYPSSELADISSANFGKLTLNQVSDKKAEFIIHSWHGDGVITVSADDETGDLLIEPSAYSSRPGVLACRWNMAGIRHDLELVAPLFQGVKLKLDDSLIRDSRWNWPMSWEAGLAILQSVSGGFYIHTEDTGYRYKALKTGNQKDPFVLGFDTEAYGPIDNNLAAGGLSWRINVFKGDWHVPAERYREWLWKAYDLKKEEEKRKPWIFDVKFAISWCPGKPEILDALAKKIAPSKVLLHFPDWRTDIYDQNYPSYVASEMVKSLFRNARQWDFM